MQLRPGVMALCGDVQMAISGKSSAFISPVAVDFTTASPRAPHAKGLEHIVIIHGSGLFRDCLRRSLGGGSASVVDFHSADAWIKSGESPLCLLIFIGLPGIDKEDDERQLGVALANAGGAHVVATGDNEDASFILDLLGKGLRGYIPSSSALEVAIGALRLVHAGGVFVPASCLLSLPRQLPASEVKQPGSDMFTAKQRLVIESIRKGKPNKTIAYELNMCESTVKVHVRNIMKKMKARNRTQVACIANSMLSSVAA